MDVLLGHKVHNAQDWLPYYGEDKQIVGYTSKTKRGTAISIAENLKMIDKTQTINKSDLQCNYILNVKGEISRDQNGIIERFKPSTQDVYQKAKDAIKELPEDVQNAISIKKGNWVKYIKL